MKQGSSNTGQQAEQDCDVFINSMCGSSFQTMMQRVRLQTEIFCCIEDSKSFSVQEEVQGRNSFDTSPDNMAQLPRASQVETSFEQKAAAKLSGLTVKIWKLTSLRKSTGEWCRNQDSCLS